MTAPAHIGGQLRTRVLLLGLLALATLVAARATGLALAQRVGLVLVLGPSAWIVIAACVAALIVAAWSLMRVQREAPAEPTNVAAGAALAALFVVLVLTWLACLLWVQPFQRLWFDLAMGIAAGVWSAIVLALRLGSLSSSRARRSAALAIFTLCAAALLAEFALRTLAAVHPLPILGRAGDGPRQNIERFRCAPGQVRFGFPCNARGFYDEELPQRADNEPWIAAIGDSFSLGAVPHARHYTTVAERLLNVPIDNIGAAGIGPAEYLSLLVDEALPREPAAVVIAIFVGNDLDAESGIARRPHERLRNWFERERVLLAVVPRRLARLARERSSTAQPALVQGENFAPSAPNGGAQSLDMPWLDDPLRETPSLSSEAFLRLEIQRALDVCAGDPPTLEACFALLREARRTTGSTPLYVLLIPDEFQVEDELWTAVVSSAGRALDRDRPQKLLAAWLEREGIPHLDLLPRLRSVAPLPDGRRHVYHLRDTHFNARGNRVAGEALVEFLTGKL